MRASRIWQKREAGSLFKIPLFVAFGRSVGDTDQNSILWFGVPSIAPGVYHRGTRLRSSQRILERNILPDSVRSDVCTDWKDDGDWTALLLTQEAER